MTTYRFDEIKDSVKFKLHCACGKRFQRTVSESQTVSPFNRHPDGTVKTRAEVWASVREAPATKTPDKFQRECPACGEQAEVAPAKVEATS